MNPLPFLESLTFIRIRILFEAVDPIVLPPYKGSAFRGCLGESLRNEVCNHRRLCEDCRERFECPFSQLFNSYVPVDHPHQRKYPKSPHPYIIDPLPGDQTELAIGENFGFDLTLIGSVIDLLPILPRTFVRMGEMGIGKGRGRFKLVDLQILTPGNGYIPLPYLGRTERLRLASLTVKEADSEVTLHLENPLRLRENGNLVRTAPEFSFFVNRLANRLGLLAHFHCGASWPEPELTAFPVPEKVRIRTEKVQMVDWRRYSGTQDTKMNFDGLIGQITYEGAGINDFMPLLTMGSYLHAGSTATFGLGKYNILNE